MVWDAIIQALEGIPLEVKDEERGIVRTHWVAGWSSNKTSGVFLEGQWHERTRLIVTLISEHEKTYASISSQREEKAPGGSQAYRWVRTTSDGIPERDFLKKLEHVLGRE